MGDQRIQRHYAARASRFHDADAAAVAAALAKIVRDPDDRPGEACDQLGKLELQIPFENEEGRDYKSYKAET